MGMLPKVKCAACGGTGMVTNRSSGPAGAKPGPAPAGAAGPKGTPCRECGGKGMKDGPAPAKGKPV